jgi:hypothetical protein
MDTINNEFQIDCYDGFILSNILRRSRTPTFLSR